MKSLKINPSQITSLERGEKELRIRMSDRTEILVNGWNEPLTTLADKLSKSMVEVLLENCTAHIALLPEMAKPSEIGL